MSFKVELILYFVETVVGEYQRNILDSGNRFFLPSEANRPEPSPVFTS